MFGVLVGGLGIVGSIAKWDEEHGAHVGGKAEALGGFSRIEISYRTGADAQVGCFKQDVGEDNGAVNVAIAAVLATLAGSLFVAAHQKSVGRSIHAGAEGIGFGDGILGTEYVNLLGLAVDGCGGQLGSVENEVNLVLFYRGGGEVADGIAVGSKLQEIFVHGCFCLGVCGCGFFGGIVAGAEAERQRQGGDEEGCFHAVLFR